MENKTATYKFTIVVPVFNEEGNMSRLETVLKEFKEQSQVKTCVLFVYKDNDEIILIIKVSNIMFEMV